MCRVILFFLLISVSASYAQYDSLFYDGRDRTYLMHVPPSYDGNTATPLVVAMHGGLTTALQMEQYSRLSEKSDAAGFLLVYPNGTGVDHTWNAGTCCGTARFWDVDDVGFVGFLIDTLKAQYNVDELRVYATGISNGGMLCYRIACDAPDLFAAIAPVAATMMMEECAEDAPLPWIHFHALPDSNVPYYGGFGQGPSGEFYRAPVDSVIGVMVTRNGCGAGPDTVLNADSAYGVTWTGCEQNADVALYVTLDGGHSWPGGHTWGFPGADPPSDEISANDLMWDFFMAHPRPDVRVDDGQAAVVVWPGLHQNYPNPFNAETTIAFDLPRASHVTLSVLNLHGQRIAVLADAGMEAGSHAVSLDARSWPSGIYIYRLETGTFSQYRKMILLR